MLVAGVDVGGTNVGVGVVADDHEVVARDKVDTPGGGPEALVETIATLVAGLGHEVAAVGVGIPGGINGDEVVHVPNLEGWTERTDLRAMLGDRLERPVALGNDADVGLLGEWLAGAAVGHDHVLGVWMGTGIGGGLILDGRPYRGSLGAAGEVGHMIVRAGGALCTCGRRGCIEAYAGRRSMAGTATAMQDAGRHTDLFAIAADEGKDRPTSKVWERALDEDDEVTVQLFDLAVETLGVGIASIVNLLDLEQVVIGGGMAEKLGQDLADRLRACADPYMLHANPDLAFVAAELGDDSGLVGAAALGRAAVLSA